MQQQLYLYRTFHTQGIQRVLNKAKKCINLQWILCKFYIQNISINPGGSEEVSLLIRLLIEVLSMFSRHPMTFELQFQQALVLMWMDFGFESRSAQSQTNSPPTVSLTLLPSVPLLLYITTKQLLTITFFFFFYLHH